MKAVVKVKKGKSCVELKEVDIPEIKNDEVLIKVKVCGICGSDVHIYHGEYPCIPPVILGHEFSGVIKEIGKEVSGWRKGERVVSELHTGICGKCYHCQRDNYLLCSHKRPAGSAINGAMAEYIAMPARLLHRIPEDISFEEAAVIEPLAICVQAIIQRSGIKMGDRVAISGPGPIGLLSLQVAWAGGASKVLISGTPRSAKLKLNKAKELGVDRIVNIEKGSLKDAVMEETNGEGVDFFIESSGNSSVIRESVEMIRKGGKICALGISKENQVNFPWKEAMFKACQINFNYSSDYDTWERSLSMVSKGKIKIKPLITHNLPLRQFEEGFRLMEKGETIKILLNPNL